MFHVPPNIRTGYKRSPKFRSPRRELHFNISFSLTCNQRTGPKPAWLSCFPQSNSYITKRNPHVTLSLFSLTHKKTCSYVYHYILLRVRAKHYFRGFLTMFNCFAGGSSSILLKCGKLTKTGKTLLFRLRLRL